MSTNSDSHKPAGKGQVSSTLSSNDPLIESNIFLDSVIENIPDMVFVKDAKELRFILFNKAGEELLGFPREQMLGKNDYDFFPKEEADFFTQKDRQVLKGGKLIDIPEEPIHTKKKGLRILHTKKIPILDSRGKPAFLLGISEDITERKQAEEGLQLYADVVRNIQIAFLVWQLEKENDPKSLRLIATNPIANQITGTNMGKFVGTTMEQSFPDLLETDLPQKYVEVIQTGKKLDIGEFRYGDENIPESDWMIKAFPLPNNCVGIAYENVTEQKRTEKEVLNAIAREQQRIGQDLHDGLGQDLTAISFLSKVLEKKLTEKTNSEVKRVKEISKLVNQSINKTRGLARGLHPVELESQGLIAALKELVANTESLYKIKCNFIGEEDLPAYVYDEAYQLYRIAQEATHNAVKHSHAKLVKLELAKEGDKIMLCIKDNGIGLKKSKTAKGMGLHIMEYRSRLIGGSLKVETLREGGTHVCCEFKPEKQTKGKGKKR